MLGLPAFCCVPHALGCIRHPPPATPPHHAGPFFSWPALFLGEHAPAGFAFINSCGAVGGFIGPYLLGEGGLGWGGGWVRQQGCRQGGGGRRVDM